MNKDGEDSREQVWANRTEIMGETQGQPSGQGGGPGRGRDPQGTRQRELGWRERKVSRTQGNGAPEKDAEKRTDKCLGKRPRF